MGVFRKMNIFGGMKIFWGHYKIGLHLRSFLSILGSVLKVKVQNGGYFWGCENFEYFLGVA